MINKSLATGMGIVFLLSTCVVGGVVENTVSNVIAICEASRYSMVTSVDDMGFRAEVYTQDVFSAAAACLSSNWTSISNEWPSIRDKYETRVVFGEMAGFTGTNAYLGFLGVVVADAQTNAVSKAMLPDFVTALQSPLRHYVIDNYSTSAVSNLILQLITVFSDDPQRTWHYRRILSGEVKREFDNLRSYGIIAPWQEDGH